VMYEASFPSSYLKSSQSPTSNVAMIIDDNNVVVGAGLVPAHEVVLSDDGSIVGVSDHDVVPVNTRATTRVAPTLGHVIGTYKSPVPNQPFNCISLFLVFHPLPITHYLLLFFDSRLCFQLNEPNEPNEPNELITPANKARDC
ncbi:MAG: hypothetical protein V3S76_00635, partial [Candidatus Bipolaricaulota bacterium]